MVKTVSQPTVISVKFNDEHCGSRPLSERTFLDSVYLCLQKFISE